VKVANMTSAKFASIDGFITDTANTTPLKEPFFQGSTTIGGTPVMNSSYYEFNPSVDEAAFTADMWAQLTQPGRFPSTLASSSIPRAMAGAGRSGRPRPAPAPPSRRSCCSPRWTIARTAARGATRMARASASGRSLRRVASRPRTWTLSCGSSRRVSPTVRAPPSPTTSTAIANNEGKGFDRMCDPTFNAPALKGALTNALPNAPLAGHWFPQQFVQLVQNAFPPIP
jgi:cellulose 1,4-beta-cellobiosidase